MIVLRSEGLAKTYGFKETAVKALKATNLEVEEGEFLVIIGPSGSGKSTLLHLLAGLDRPSAGKVFISGKNIYDLNEKERSIFRRENIGFVFQAFNLIPILSAEENIKLPILMDGKTVDKKYLEELMDVLNIKDRRKHLPSELSGGQQQRVSIARALANKPSIIFADEPTGNLDSNSSKEVLHLLKETINKYHQTLIMITHDSSIAAMADRVITIADGVIVKDYKVI